MILENRREIHTPLSTSVELSRGKVFHRTMVLIQKALLPKEN